MASSPPRKPSGKKARSLIESADVPIQFGVPSEPASDGLVDIAPPADFAMAEDALDIPELGEALDMAAEPVVEVVAAPVLPAASAPAASADTTITAPMTATAAIAPVDLDIAAVDLSRVDFAAPVSPPTATTEPQKGSTMDETTSTTNAAFTDTMNNAGTKAAGMMHGAAETMQNAASDMQARGAAMMGDMSGRAKSAVEKGTKAVEELVEFQKGNLEALMTSGRTATSGAQEIAKYSAEYGRATIEKANATARQFASVKSPTEFFQLQGEIAKQMLDGMVAEGAKFTESYMKLMGEVAQPLSNRVAVAVDKVKTTVGSQG